LLVLNAWVNLILYIPYLAHNYKHKNFNLLRRTKKMDSRIRKLLRSQAHHLEPVVLIGKNGITDGTIESIDRVLEAQELIKIKFREFKDEKLSLSEKITELTNAQIVGVIGHTVIIFRQNPDPDKRQIHIP
jgi:RNA-binding protein